MDGSSHHIGLTPHCGVCADSILTHERAIALRGNADSTAYSDLTSPFPFPRLGHTLSQVDGRRVCRLPAGCSICAKSPEFVALHYDCYRIFCEKCSIDPVAALAHLWVVAAWRRPWRYANPVRLHRGTALFDDDDRVEFAEAARSGGLPLLPTLPWELVEEVRRYSRHNLLWRCIAAISLALRVSTSATGYATMEWAQLTTVSLRDIASWNRGGQLMMRTAPPPELKGAAQAPFILLTLDISGICRIERLTERPIYNGECKSSSAFIVLKDDKLLDCVAAQLKHGRLRLRFQNEACCLPIWNTPAPPDMASVSCVESGRHPAWDQFYAVEMDRVAGITFAMASGYLKGVHIHYSDESSAEETFEDEPRRVVWIHLPIAKKDRLVVLGVRKYTSGLTVVLARMQLAGDVFIGRPGTGQAKDTYLGFAPPLTLVYREPSERFGMQFLGAYCRRRPADLCSLMRFPSLPPRPPFADEHSCFSWAPLAGVIKALTFYDPNTGFCRGIYFYYENGGKRAVGQCRLHVDPAKHVVRPQTLCLHVKVPLDRHQRDVRQALVEFRSSTQHKQEKDWTCYAMEGQIHFWFTQCTSVVQIF